MGILRVKQFVHPLIYEISILEISKSLQLKDEAAIITVNGRGDTVSLGYNTYNMLKSKIELLSLSCRRAKTISFKVALHT